MILKDLAFEVHQFRSYAHLDTQLELRNICPAAAQAVTYALLVHFRVLLDFFYSPANRRADDCVVDDFSALPGFETSFGTPDPNPAISAVRENLNKRLAHLTTIRWQREAPYMDHYSAHFGHLNNCIDRFEAALPHQLRTTFQEALSECQRRFSFEIRLGS